MLDRKARSDAVAEYLGVSRRLLQSSLAKFLLSLSHSRRSPFVARLSGALLRDVHRAYRFLLIPSSSNVDNARFLVAIVAWVLPSRKYSVYKHANTKARRCL